MSRCSCHACSSEVTVFCADCLEAFCAAHNKALHIAHPLHKRTSVADKQAASAVMLHTSAETLRTVVGELAQRLSAELSTASAKRDALQQQLSDLEKKLRTKEATCASTQAQLTNVQGMLTSLVSGSDRQVVDICASAIAGGTLQLNKRMPEGLLHTLSVSQQEHFHRVLPHVEQVSQPLVQCDGASLAAC